MRHIHIYNPDGKPVGCREAPKIRIFASPDGRLRAADDGRGGWRMPTALDLALSIPPALRLSGYRAEG